jgi:hypothetical protein
MTRDEFSGVIECGEDVLTYRSGFGDWAIPIAGIRLIAEYTTSDGPWLDDYFFVFLTAAEGGWHEASFYAEGREAALRELGSKIGARLDAGLCASTEYRTRILWPGAFRDQPLMDVVPAPKRTLWRKLVGNGSRDIVLSSAARRIFDGGRAHGAASVLGDGTADSTPMDADSD